MAAIQSSMLTLGTTMPDFELLEPATGKNWNTKQIPQKNLVLIMFICNHCPYVIHVAKEIALIAEDFSNEPVSIFGINSNDVEQYPDDSPDNMRKEVQLRKYKFPYLYDMDQKVARLFQAACTPDFFLFDKEKKLVYRGQLDDSRPGKEIPVTGSDLRTAMLETLNNRKVSEKQKPSLGCSIKWKNPVI